MTSSYFEFFSPVKLVAGESALEHLPFELKNFGSSRPMLISDKGVLGAGLVDQVKSVFQAAGMEVSAEFYEVPPDSDVRVVSKAAELYRQNQCDSIIAIGGGSVIDSAKGVNILASENSTDISEFAGSGALKRALNPFFVIPTTAGTGSEVTLVAVIKDHDKGIKLSFASPFLLPNAAVLDPRMTLTLPPHITAATGMDALTHAVEAYICMAKNPVSDAFAVAAIKKIVKNLLNVVKQPDDINGRLELAEAATMAGIAFSNSMVGLVHALGHSAGAVCHLPHGLCMSIFLPWVLEYNLEKSGDKIGELLLPMLGAEVYASTPASQRPRKVIDFIHQLKAELNSVCNLPISLSETGKVTQEQLHQIADMTLNDGALIYNPAEADYDEALALLKKAY